MEKMFILAGIFLILSTLFSMLGIGGGVLYVPILLFAGYSIKIAPGISHIVIFSTSFAALLHFNKKKMVDWKLAMVIDPPTDIMAFAGGYYSTLFPEKVLELLLAVVLIIVGILMLKPQKKERTVIKPGTFGYWHRTFNGVDYVVNLPLVLTATAFIGLLSGMLGITGGVIKLPIMVLLCGVPMGVAVATSTAMVALTAMSALLGRGFAGTIDWRTGVILAVVTIVGGLQGSRLSLKVDKVKLQKLFSVLVLSVAAKIIYDILFLL